MSLHTWYMHYYTSDQWSGWGITVNELWKSNSTFYMDHIRTNATTTIWIGKMVILQRGGLCPYAYWIQTQTWAISSHIIFESNGNANERVAIGFNTSRAHVYGISTWANVQTACHLCPFKICSPLYPKAPASTTTLMKDIIKITKM